MRAVVVEKWMEPADLEVGEIPTPEPEAGSLLVEVAAAGCNFSDLLIVQGRYQVKPPFPFTPGAELAGTVRSLGPGVEGFAVGDRVLASPGTGAFAEFAAVPAATAQRLPDAIPFDHAAALPIIYSTSYAALVDRASLVPGEVLLVHAAAGGVGVAAVQIGTALGARVIATAGGAAKLDVARAHGASEAIDYREEDFAQRVLELTDGRGADVIYDSVGGDVFERSLKCIAWNGRLLVIGFASGTIPEVKINRILLKNIALSGLHWSAYADRDPVRVSQILKELFVLYESGKIAPVIYDHFDLDDLPHALAELASRRTHGKLIINP
ncbi:NADPH:quinone oxidoreductase family protein [Myxococcota bacterium]|nr:NADPH:quinone oxidoreductase family protein [Myxococcota bacterium]